MTDDRPLLLKVFTHVQTWAHDVPFLIHMVWYDVGPPFVGKTASTLLARYSTSLAVFMGILHHFFSEEHWWCQTDLLDEKAWLANSALIHPKGVLSWVEVRILCRPVKFFDTKLAYPCLYGPLLFALVGGRVGTGRGHPQSVLTKLRAWSCPKCLGMLKQQFFHWN